MNIDYEKEYADKSLIEKTGYCLQTVYNTGKFYANILPNLFSQPEGAKLICPNKNNTYDKINWNESNNGLIVVIHGLLGSPKTLGYEIAKKMSLHNANFEVILPIIPFKGNCSLELAAKPLYELILDYIQSNLSEKKPIHFIACSNGCRIASWIEYELRNINVNIKLTCIAGAFGGSVLIDKLSLPLSVILHNEIITDLSTNSKINKELKEKISSELKIGSRHYEFYGTANDWYIPNFKDCFPDISKAESLVNFNIDYHDLNYGYDHVSLGWYLSDEIIDNSLRWMEFIRNKTNN